MGATWAQPPPVAPPFRPNTGPKDGSRRAAMTLQPMRRRPSVRPMATVVLPSPSEVGLMAVTRQSLPVGTHSPAAILAL